MGKGIAALSYLPAARIVINNGTDATFSVESFKAAVNKVARLQEEEAAAGSFTEVPCLMDNPFTSCSWDIDISQTAGATASGTVTAASAQAGDTVTVNGLVYTAVSGAKADNTEFSIDTGDTETAADLADSITNDTREGTFNDVTAENASAVVTITADREGAASNAITLVSSNGARLAVSGSGTLAGGADQIDYELEFDAEDVDVVDTLGRPALATRRVLNIDVAPYNDYAFTVRSLLAAVKFIEKLEDKVASTGDGATGDGTYTGTAVKGNTPFKTYTWDIVKSGDDYTLTPTENS